MRDFFKLKEHGTTVKQEISGGVVTFLTMAYIIFVNPQILSEAGMDKGAVITVTCLAAFIGTMIVALWANVPFAMAPGMGLNAFFTYTLVMQKGMSWQTALGIVFLSGVIFLILTILGIREKVVNAIPISIRLAIAAGIGLFITFIGFKNMGLIVSNPATLVGLGKFNTPVILGLVGLVTIAVLDVKKIKGSILWGIIITTILGIIFKVVTLPAINFTTAASFIDKISLFINSIVSMPASIEPTMFKLDIKTALQISFIGPIFSFMFMDLFDSVGTIVACSYEAGMVQRDGTIKKIDKMLEADAIATLVGALLGTSTTTTYIESASGIGNGARTGLSSIVTALLFVAALFFAPVIGIVPAFATAPALIIVGVYMFRNIKNIDFSDFEVSLPSFLIIIIMPLTSSISMGLTFGFLSYIIIALASGDFKKISPVTWIIGFFAALNLIFEMGLNVL